MHTYTRLHTPSQHLQELAARELAKLRRLGDDAMEEEPGWDEPEKDNDESEALTLCCLVVHMLLETLYSQCLTILYIIRCHQLYNASTYTFSSVTPCNTLVACHMRGSSRRL